MHANTLTLTHTISLLSSALSSSSLQRKLLSLTTSPPPSSRAQPPVSWDKLTGQDTRLHKRPEWAPLCSNYQACWDVLWPPDTGCLASGGLVRMTLLADSDLSMFTSHHKLPISALDVSMCVFVCVCACVRVCASLREQWLCVQMLQHKVIWLGLWNLEFWIPRDISDKTKT